jgi:hypothetical protein
MRERNVIKLNTLWIVAAALNIEMLHWLHNINLNQYRAFRISQMEFAIWGSKFNQLAIDILGFFLDYEGGLFTKQNTRFLRIGRYNYCPSEGNAGISSKN